MTHLCSLWPTCARCNSPVLAVSPLRLQWPRACCDPPELAVTHLSLQWPTWTCSDSPELAVTHLSLQWPTCACTDPPELAVTHLSLQWPTGDCSDPPELCSDPPEFAVTHLSFLWSLSLSGICEMEFPRQMTASNCPLPSMSLGKVNQLASSITANERKYNVVVSILHGSSTGTTFTYCFRLVDQSCSYL